MLIAGFTATAQDGWVYSAFNPTLPTLSSHIVTKDYATDDLYVCYYISSSSFSIKRINASTGAASGSFNIPANFSVKPTAMLVQSDGKLIVYGSFSSYNGSSTYKRIVRFNTNGSIDTSFSQVGNIFVESNFICRTIAENGSKIILGGTTSSTDYNMLFQINKSNGSPDTTFNNNASHITTLFNPFQIQECINDIYVNSPNEIYIGGYFGSYTGAIGANDGFLCKITSTGVLSTSFDIDETVFATTINSIDKQSNNKLIVGGVDGTLVRFNTDGSLDNTFTSPTITGVSTFGNPRVNKVQVQPSDKIIFAGEFTTVNGVSRNDIARVNSNGTTDLTFDPAGGSNVFIDNIILDSTNNLYVIGQFSSFGSYTRKYLIKISTSVMGRPALDVDIPEISNNKISVFPNPSNGIFNLQMDGYEGETFELTMYNTLGQTIIEKTLTGENNYQIDLTGQNTGNYFIKLANNNTVINKIIVKK